MAAHATPSQMVAAAVALMLWALMEQAQLAVQVVLVSHPLLQVRR
jgi:hypothetical protein